jgi:DNA-binding response OmpR family regulator
MASILLGVREARLARELSERLSRYGFKVEVSEGCEETTKRASRHGGGRLNAIVLDSGLVAASMHDNHEDIISNLQREADARILVFMTKPFQEVSDTMRRTILRSDAIVEMPVTPSTVVSRLNTMLGQPKTIREPAEGQQAST